MSREQAKQQAAAARNPSTLLAGLLRRGARSAPRAAAPFKRKLLVETIEQRVLMDAEPLAVVTAGGSIDSAGEVDSYTFNLASGARVAFDSLMSNGNLNWTLSGPSGKVIDGATFAAQSGNTANYRPLDLAAGSYRIDVAGTGASTGSYKLNVMDLSRATGIALDTAVTGVIPEKGQTVAYGFDAAAGDQLFLTWQKHPEVNLRIYDPFGQQVGSGDGWTGDSSIPQLAYTGRYTVLVDASGSVADGAEFGFLLHRTVAPVQELGAWSGAVLPIQAILEGAGDRAVITFTLDAARTVLLDSLTGNDQLRLSLTGPLGVVHDSDGAAITDRGMNSLDHGSGGLSRVQLAAGTYTLVLNGSGATKGAVALRLVDIGNAPVISRGAVVAGELTPGASVHAVHFDAAAGDTIDFDVLSITAGTSPSFKLIDPYGRTVTYGWSMHDSNTIKLTANGRYTMVISGENTRSATTQFSYRLVDRGNTPPAPLPVGTSLALGEVFDASIAANETRVVNFTLDGTTKLYIDPLSQVGAEDSVKWSLTGPRGEEQTNVDFGGYATQSWDDGGRLVTLPAGTYALTVKATSAQPSLKLRVLAVDSATAAPVLPNTTVSGTLNPGAGMTTYRFQGTAGQRLFFNALSGTDSDFLNYRVLDPSGRTLIAVRNWSDLETTLKLTGTYTVLVEGANSIGAKPLDYRFMVTLPQDGSAVLNPAVGMGTAPTWTTDGSQPAVRLDGRNDIRVEPSSQLNLAKDVSFQVRVRVDSLTQEWQNIVYKGANINDANHRSYTLWVNSAGYLHLTTTEGSSQVHLDTANGAIKAGEWYDLTGVIDRTSGSMRIYINGELAASRAISTTGSARVQDTPLYLGNSNEGGNPHRLDGALAEFRLWDRALGDAEVDALEQGAPAVDANLKLWLKLNEGSGSALTDSSQYGLSAAVKSRFDGMSGVVAGNISLPGEQDVYRLSLDQTTTFYLDSLTPEFAGSLRLAIDGPNIAFEESLVTMTNRMITLVAGDYTFTVNGSDRATGPYAFRLLDRAAAPVIQFGQTVTGNLPQPDTATMYSFEANAGDALFFQNLGWSGGFHPAWRLIDPFGRELQGRASLDHREPAPLAYSGTYTLVIDGAYHHQGNKAAQFSFAVHKVNPAAPIAINPFAGHDGGVSRAPGKTGGGVQVGDTQHIEVPDAGAWDATGTFSLQTTFRVDKWSANEWVPLLVKSSPDSTRQIGVYLNSAGRIHVGTYPNNSNSYNSVESANGLVKAGEWNNVAAVFDRAAGQVRIILNGVQVAQGSLSATPAVNLSAPLRIGYSNETSDYRGALVTIDQVAVWNRVLAAAEVPANGAELSGTETGLAALLKLNEESGAAVQDAKGGPAGSIVRMAQVVPGLIAGRIEQPGQVVRYTFTLNEAKQVYLDSLTRRTDLYWTLSGAGVSYNSSLYHADATSTRGLLDLAAGTYTLTLDGDKAATGDYMLRLLDAAAATGITLDQNVSATLPMGAEAKIFRFNAEAGQRIYLDHLANTSTAPAWRLIDPLGKTLFGPTTMANRGPLDLARTGTYTLIVEDNTNGGRDQARDYSFNLRTVEDRSIDIALNERLLWDPVWNAGAVQFNNGQQVVVAPSAQHDLGGNLTVEAMVKLDKAGPGWMPVVSRGEGYSSQSYGIWIGAQGQVYFDSNDAGNFWNLGTGNNAIVPGDWHRISVSVNRTTGAAAMYIDGQQVASKTLGSNERDPATGLPNAELRIGGTALTDNRQQLTGSVADVRLWNLALSGAQIASQHGAALSGSEAGLVLNLKMNEGSGRNLADASANGLSGKIESINARLPGSLVEGEIRKAGETVNYVFTAGQTGLYLFDGLTAANNFNWTLRDATGAVVTDQHGTALSNRNLRHNDNTNRVDFLLHAGREYRLEIDADTDSTGRYAFRLLGLNAAQTIAYDTAIDNTLDPANALALYAFDGAAGDQVRLDYLSHAGDAPYWRLYDTNGVEIHNKNFAESGQSLLTLEKSGRYVLVIDGHIDATGAARQRFQVQLAGKVAPPVAPGSSALNFVDGVAALSGVHAELNQPQLYSFTIDTPRRFYVDATTLSAHASQWKLSGPFGQVGARAISGTDSSDHRSFYELPAGSYTFSAWATTAASLGAYAFRLVDLTVAPKALSFGVPTDGALTPANTSNFYKFSGQEGERLYFGNNSSTNTTNAYWRVLDAETLAVVAENGYGTALNNVVLPRDGAYLLAVEGYHSTTGDASYRFTAWRNTAPTAPLQMGERMAGNLAQPGDMLRYTFSLNADSRLLFDSLNGRTDVVWRVLDSEGVAVFDDRDLWDNPGEAAALMTLKKGSYTLVIDGTGSATGAVPFRLLNLANAIAITPGTAVTDGQLNPGNSSVAYRFDAVAGDSFYFDVLAKTGGTNAQWRLLDPYGNAVFNDVGLADRAATTMPFSGRYTLIVEGYPTDGAATFSFNVVPVVAQTPVPLSIGVGAAPNLKVQDLAAVGVPAAPGGDTAIQSGGKVDVSWFSANTGSRPLTVPFQERVVVRNAAGETLVNQLVSYDPASQGEIAAGARVARSTQITLPAGSRGAGALTISVITDVSNAVPEEGASGESDNLSQLAVQSQLATYPDLKVTNVVMTPAENLAPGAQVKVSWRINNAGDKATSTPWSDRVVVRNLSTGQVVYDDYLAVQGTAAQIAAGSGAERELVFQWPAGRDAAGKFEVIVTADAKTQVAENNKTNDAETNNSATIAFTSAPDLSVEDLQVVTASPVSGGQVQLTWNVKNGGNAPTPTGWFDRIVAYNLDTEQTLLNLEVAYTPDAPIAAGGQAQRSFTLRLPEGVASVGRIRFSVTADQNAAGAGTLPESNENNNKAEVEKSATLSKTANLAVEEFQAPAAHRSGDAAPFSWTVKNTGTAATTATQWYDRIVLSKDAIIGNADDVTVASVLHEGALAGGASYTVNVDQLIPAGYDGNYHFALVTDVLGQVTEPDGENDNASAPVASLLTAYHADLIPVVTALPSAANGGQKVEVSWTVTNSGDAPTNTSYWEDSVWLSLDGSTDPAKGAIHLGNFGHSGVLAKDASYVATHQVTIPNGIAGAYKLVVKVNRNDQVFESRYNSNNTAVSSGAITVSAAPAVNLTVQNVQGPATAQPGVRQTVSWEIANTGAGTASGWTDRVYLSRDGSLANAIFLASVNQTAPLTGGQKLAASAQFWMPDAGDGAWQIVVVTDATNSVYESGAADAESANSASRATSVINPDVSASNVTVAAGATAGRPANITWITVNNGTASVVPGWMEKMFISLDDKLDGNDILLGSFAVEQALGAAGSATDSLTRSAQVMLPQSLAAGSWRILVQSDSGNAVKESTAGEANNLAASNAVQVAPASLANLAPSNVAGPATMRPGTTVNVSWIEANLNPEPVNGSWAAQIFLSRDGVLGGDELVATLPFTGTLAGNATAQRSAQVTLPATLAPGNWRFVVKLDSGNAVVESSEQDNSAIAAADSKVVPSLQLNLQAASVAEATTGGSNGAATTTATITRNGDLSQPLTIALSTSDTSEATTPATVTIPAGQSQVSFNIGLPADGVVDGVQQVQIGVSAAGFEGDSRTLSVTDSDQPSLAVTTVATAHEDGGTVQVTVSRNAVLGDGGVAGGALLVRLTSGNTGALRVPGTVIIPAGQNSVTFNAELINDSAVWGTRAVHINATAAGYRAHSTTLNLIDDELPELSMVFSSAQVAENAGTGAVGVTVKRDRPGQYDLVLSVGTDNKAMGAPTRVVIKAGDTEAHFSLTPKDDTEVNGSRQVFVRTTMLSAGGSFIDQNAATASVILTDNDGPTLAVTLDQEDVSEKGAPVTGTVRRNTGTTGDLTVNLTSSDTGEATVLGTVVIKDGQDSATFSITPVADNTPDGAQNVTIRATAAGFNSGAAGLRVTEGDLPDLEVIEITQPASGYAGERVTISWTVRNNGLVDAAGGFRDRVFLSIDGELSAADRLMTSVVHSSPVAKDGTYTQTASIQLPTQTGRFRVVVITDGLGSIAEGSERNNATFSTAELLVKPPITVSASTSVTQLAVGGEANATIVPISGVALDAVTGQPAANQAIKVVVKVGEVRRTLNALTDAEGKYTVEFKPLPGEAGVFQVGAGYAGEIDVPMQDSFTIIGMQASVAYVRAMGTNETELTGSFSLKNLGSVALSDLKASIEGLSSNFQFEVVNLAGSLAGGGTATVNWRLVGHGVTEALATNRGMLTLTTAEGVTEKVVLDLAMIPQTPKLVASQPFIHQGMLVGTQTLVSIDIMNQGAVASGPVKVELPDYPWMKLASDAVIADIPPGGKATVTLSLQPGADLALIRYDGAIALNSALGGITVPFELRATSEAKGEMRVTVEDQLTYYAEGAPKVAGATVTLTDPYTYAVVATAVTGENGSVLLSGVPVGKYILTVNADKHTSYRATHTISAGTTTEETIFLDRQLVSYAWNVVPTEVEDKYKIALESTFETEVPVPVITAEPLKMPIMLPNVTSKFTIKITNSGLVQAENVAISVPQNDPLFEIVALTPMIDVLPANSSVEVPVTIRLRDGVTPEQVKASTIRNEVMPEGWGPALIQCFGIKTVYQLRCGPDGRWYGADTSVKPLLCLMDLETTSLGQLASYISDDASAAGAACDVLDLLLSCYTDNDCLAWLINTACGAAVGGATGGVAGAVAGAAGALDDLLSCLCDKFGPFSLPDIGGGEIKDPPGGWSGGSWGWFPSDGFPVSVPWDVIIKPAECKAAPVTALEMDRAEAGLEAAMASGAVGADAAQIVAAHSASRAEQLAALAADGDGILNQEEAGICAEVRIRIDQEAVLTRTAFQGTLEITNGNTGVPLTGVQLTLDIRDENGNSVNDLFATRDPVLNGLTAVDGTGVLAGGASGRAQYLFLPTTDAAKTQPTRYTIGGTLSYIEGGQKITVPLMPAKITVHPEAQLNLHYFQQRDVIGDDPFTKDVVEASDPFALGLLVYNDGAGAAKNLTITSAQPKIIENEKGLLIDFKIIGTQVGTDAVAPTLTANLGNIAAGKTQVAQWMLSSTLQGKFTEFTASFEHVDGMGDERLSLIKSVNVHELIRSVKANGGDAPDFLANDDPDSEHTPDRLYMNDGSQHIVRPIANATVKGTVSPGSLSVKIDADQRAGWGYLKVADPGAGFVLDRIVRSDGKVLNLGREVWRTDRSFPESTPGAVRENLLHFIDENSTGEYTVFYKLDDSVAPRLTEIVAVSPDPATGPIAHIDIRFSEQVNPNTLTVADLHLSREGETANQLANAQDVTITALGDGLYRIGGLQPYTAMSGLYRLTVDATGVSDYAGNAGTGVLTETWGVGNVGPYVLSMASGPAARSTALDTVDVTFSSALDVASFSAADLRLERDGVLQSLEGASLSLTPLAGNQYRIGGLAAFTAAGGSYTLTLVGSGLLSSNGAAGLGSQSVGWRMDTAAPTVLNIVDLVQEMRKIVVPSLDVELSEQVDLSTFDFRDVVLTRTFNGVTSANLIDAQTKVEHVSGSTYRISGFNWVSGQPGVYKLTVDGAGIKDAAGNSGSGSATQSWTMDTSDPLAATNLAVSPDAGVANNDGVIKTLAFTLTGSLSEPGLEVRVSDRTSGNEIGYATVNGTSFTIPVKLDAAGRHELRVRSVDAAGNVSDATMIVFVDLVAPSLEEPVLTRDAQGNVGAITLNFSEPVDEASVTLDVFSLKRDGAAIQLEGVTLTRVSATQYVLQGLAALTAPAGGYKLAVDMTRVRDLAGNSGISVKEHQFDGALASKGVVSGILFDDIDGSGTREADELLQGGWTVFDDVDGDGVLDAGEKSAVTDSAGKYELKGLALGERRIVVVVPNGWAITPGPVAQVTLSAAAPTATRNFGAFALASISGTVFDDANANGLRDAGEAVLAGKQVLHDLNNNGVADEGEATAVTGADGKYLLSKLKPGAGRLVIFAGEGFVPLLPFGVYAPKSGEAGLRGFALVKPGSLSGTKYEDVNGNGQRDEGENGVAGWRIFLDANGNDALDEGERSTLTDANGQYTFTGLAPGSYRVVEETRAGWIQTAPGTVEASNGQQTMDAQLSLPGMIADMEQEYIIKYLDSTGANFDCGCGTFVLEKYTTGQAAGHFTKLNTITDPALQGLTGKGVRVAVIDTGINTGSSFFGPDANGDGVADRIAYQYDFGDDDNDASDTMGHGTNVAGVIAGADAKYDGVATEADLVVLKVFDSNNAGFLSTLRKSLEWLDANAEKYGIGVVNMSLGDGGNWGDAISRYGMGELFERLAAKGLVMVAASGNNYAATGGGLGVAYPGADPAVLSVGAMWAGNFGGPWRFSNGATDYTTAYGRIASFTQRDPDQIDVMAPGARFTSAGLNGGLSTMQGTSQAAAFMSGAAALVQQAAKQLMGRYLNTGEFAALLDVYTYRAVDGDDESDNVVNSGASYNKLDIPKLLKGLKAYAATGQLPDGAKPGGTEVPGDSPLTAYSPLTATVLPGQTLSGQDFGNFKLGQVGGEVYTDANRDGVKQEGETALAGVTMYIDKDDDGVLDENETRVVTNAEGKFNFVAVGPGLARIRAVAPQGQQVIGEAVREVTVTSGAQDASLGFGIGVAGGPVAANDNATVNEDASVIVDVVANDTAVGEAPVLALEGAGPANGTVELVDGKFVYKPKANFFGTDSFRYKVTGAGGVSSIAKVTVTVVPVNDVPVIAPVETSTAVEGQQLVIKLAATDADKDTLGWTLVSGPQGATIDALTGELRWTAQAAAAPQEFKVKVSDGKGGHAERTFSIDVQAAKLVVTAFASHAAGFTIRFNDVIDQSRFNLYGANSDLEVRGAKAGLVAGSVVFDADGKGFQFVRTGDAFGADAYTVRLKSGENGVTSVRRGQLDGDANGTAGGDYVSGFDVAAVAPVRLRLPDFARSAGQPLKVPNTGAGMPVSITSDGSATSLQFKLLVDPGLIAVSEVRAGSGLPSGASLQVTAIEGGFLVNIQSASAIPAGSRQLLDVVGSMAAAAPAGAAGVLRIDEVMVNGAAVADAGDRGVVFIGNVGDIDRNGVYDANDVSKLQRLVVKLDSFVAGADDIDPTVIGDVDADGVLSTRDVALVQARTRAASTPAIPAVVAPVAAQASLGVASSGVTVNLGGSLGNFSLGAPSAPVGALTVSRGAPVALKIVPSVVSEGV